MLYVDAVLMLSFINNNNLPENEMKQNSAVSSQESARVGAHCTTGHCRHCIICADMSSVK